MLNELEKKNIRSTLKDWSIQVLRRNAYPVIFIAVTKDSDGKDVLLWKGGHFSNAQTKSFLRYLLDSMPDEG